MFHYEQKEKYIRVKWKKLELGRILTGEGGWAYHPRGCGGQLKSESFRTLQALKTYLEQTELDIT